jgi:hypothetical protein
LPIIYRCRRNPKGIENKLIIEPPENLPPTALTSAQRTLNLSNRSPHRYKASLEQYLDINLVQAVELNHQQNVVQLNGQKLAASGGRANTFPTRKETTQRVLNQ